MSEINSNCGSFANLDVIFMRIVTGVRQISLIDMYFWIAAVSGRRTDSEETGGSKFVRGLVIGLSIGLVVIILVGLGIYCVKRKQKEESTSYSVPKTPEHSPRSDCHYSPINGQNGVSTRGRPSSESQSKENSRNTRQNTCLTFKGFILCRTERAPSESV